MHVSSKLFKRGAILVAGAMVALGVGTATAGSASAAPSPGVCSGGSISPGVYSSLSITGWCTVDAGNVFVTGNATVQANEALVAAFGGSQFVVKGQLTVGPNAVLVLGCEPDAFECLNDPDPSGGTMSTNDVVGSLVGNGAAAILAHHNSIKTNVKQNNGGGDPLCFDSDPRVGGGPDYTTYEDNNVGGNMTITKLNTCWSGVIRNNVVGTVVFNNNATFDPDGNEIVTNHIGGDLKCQGNNPPPQAGDSSGGPNEVAGARTGQCRSTLLP